MASDVFTQPLSRMVWETRYRHVDGTHRETCIDDTWWRIARALAAPERHDRETWAARFHDLLEGFRFLPGGRIQAGAGSGQQVTLFNCFVMGVLEDSIPGIFRALEESAITLQQGGGVGFDFSTLRPAGDRADATGGVATGPVSFMHVWDRMCETLLATSVRRGAMMATLACDHPDVERFVAAKRDPAALRRFNLSVLVSDAFMEAVEHDDDWPLRFPCAAGQPAPRHGPRAPRGSVRARALWDAIMRANYDCAEPGVIFVDRVQSQNNLRYCEHISATNPCGEIPLPPYGACDLGSLDLPQFVTAPFTAAAGLDRDGLRDAARLAVRMLDNVYEISAFPLQVQHDVALRSRRLGLGITGLADALMMLGLRYGTPASIEWAADVMRDICHAAYVASTGLARQRGAFPAFDCESYLRSPFVAALPAEIRAAIRTHGIRNSHLTAIAPTGSVSLLANNVSSGLEPVFAGAHERRVRHADGTVRTECVVDYGVQRYGRSPEIRTDDRPRSWKRRSVAPEDQLALQAALQAHVDNAISKTVSVPGDFPFARFRTLFERAHALGLKGCTTFRPNAITGSVLVGATDVDSCCAIAEPPAGAGA